MLWKGILLLLVIAASLFATDPPKPGSDALGRWAGGKWVAEGKGVDSEFSKANTVSGVSTCAWSPDHVFVVCDQAFTVNGKADRALSIFGFDPEKSVYHMFGMSPTGERPRVADLNISPDHNRWEYPNTAEINGKQVQFRTVNVFRDNDHVDFWTEYSTDNGAHWTKTLEGKESRQK
jgi:hypothetical protein